MFVKRELPVGRLFFFAFEWGIVYVILPRAIEYNSLYFRLFIDYIRLFDIINTLHIFV